MTKSLTMRLIPALMMMGFAGVASASGCALQNQTGSNNGNAFAGAAAAACGEREGEEQHRCGAE